VLHPSTGRDVRADHRCAECNDDSKATRSPDEESAGPRMWIEELRAGHPVATLAGSREVARQSLDFGRGTHLPQRGGMHRPVEASELARWLLLVRLRAFGSRSHQRRARKERCCPWPLSRSAVEGCSVGGGARGRRSFGLGRSVVDRRGSRAAAPPSAPADSRSRRRARGNRSGRRRFFRGRSFASRAPPPTAHPSTAAATEGHGQQRSFRARL